MPSWVAHGAMADTLRLSGLCGNILGKTTKNHVKDQKLIEGIGQFFSNDRLEVRFAIHTTAQVLLQFIPTPLSAILMGTHGGGKFLLIERNRDITYALNIYPQILCCHWATTDLWIGSNYNNKTVNLP